MKQANFSNDVPLYVASGLLTYGDTAGGLLDSHCNCCNEFEIFAEHDTHHGCVENM